MRRRLFILLFLLFTMSFCGFGTNTVVGSAYSRTVSNKTVTMPNVVGMDMYDAIELLENAGFSNVRTNANDKTYLWIVTGQNIEANKKIDKNSKVKLECKKSCILTLDFKSKENLVFSRYSMDVIFDGEKMGVVANGDPWTYSFKVLEGEHYLSFSQCDNPSKAYTVILPVTANAEYKCEIDHGSSIRADNENFVLYTEGAAIEMPDCCGKLAVDAIAKLNSLGIKHIERKGYAGIQEKSLIIGQSVKPGRYIDSTYAVTFECVSYEEKLREEYPNTTFDVAYKKAKDSNLSIVVFDVYKGSDLTNELKRSTDSERNKWVVQDISFTNSSRKTITFKVDYFGESQIPDSLVGMDVESATQKLRDARFTNVSYQPALNLSDKKIWQWYVADINYESGAIVNSKENIEIVAERRTKEMNFVNKSDQAYDLLIGSETEIVYAIAPDDVQLKEWDFVNSDKSIIETSDKRVYSEDGINYLSFKVIAKNAGSSSLVVASVYEEESEPIEFNVREFKIKAFPSFKCSISSMRVDDSIDYTFPVLSEEELSWDDIVVEVSDTSVLAIKKGEIVREDGKSTLHFSAKGKSAGTAEISLASAEGNLSTDPISLTVKAKSRVVYVTPTGECYHYSSTCGGANSSPAYLDEVPNLRACKKCVH